MPRSMKMAEIKRILKLVEEEPGLSERKMGEIVGCSKNPVLAPLTHDGKGQLLNTNADTIAGEAA